jgi:hypothetical protein
MRERGIARRLVQLNLRQPDRVYIGAQGNLVAEKPFSSGTIRVVYVDRIEPAGRCRHAITVMWK